MIKMMFGRFELLVRLLELAVEQPPFDNTAAIAPLATRLINSRRFINVSPLPTSYVTEHRNQGKAI
jgi:hypothetical protein